MNVFALPIAIALLVVAFVAIMRALQDHYGGVLQTRTAAYVMLGFAVALDLLILTFSVSICSYVVRNGLEIRGYVLDNAEALRIFLGTADEDDPVSIAGIWGFIIPVLSWVTAHGVVLGLIETIRLLPAVLADRTVAAGQAGSLAARRAATRMQRRAMQLCGFALTGIGAFLVFRIVINFDRTLFQFEMIDQTSLRKLLGGRYWAAQHSPDEVARILGRSFLGQMALHAGDFYVVCLFVSAFLLVVAIHRAWHAGTHQPGALANLDPAGTMIMVGRPVQYPPGLAPTGPPQGPAPGLGNPPGPEQPPEPPTPLEEEPIYLEEQR